MTGDTWGDCIPGDTGCANITVFGDAMGEHVRSEHTAEEMAEARRLYAEKWAEREGLNDETFALISRQSDLLTRTVNILRGDPPPLTSWSHHDLPELAAEKVSEVARLTAERDALAAAHARESEKVWKVEEVMDDIEGSDPTTWERLRDALAGSDADATDTQPTGQERCPTCAKTRDDLTPGPHAEGWGHCPESFHFRNILTDQEGK